MTEAQKRHAIKAQADRDQRRAKREANNRRAQAAPKRKGRR